MSVKRIFKKLLGSKPDLDNLPRLSKSGPNSVWKKLDRWTATLPANTQRRYKSVLSEYCNVFGMERDQEGAEIFCLANSENAFEYVEWCKARPAQPGRSALVSDRVSLATVRNKALVMFSIYRHTTLLGLTKENPFEPVKRQFAKVQGGDRRQPKLVPFEKVDELMSLDWSRFRDGPRDKAIMAACFGGALRRSEVMKLRLIDLQKDDSGRTKLLLRDTKKQRSETKEIPKWAALILEEYVVIRKAEGATQSDPIFTRYIKGVSTKDFIDERTFLRLFKRCLARVGLTEDYSCHCARVTSITRLLRSGVPIHDVSQWVGHSSISTTIRYHRFSDDHSSKVADALDYKPKNDESE